jgi:hypothetical protein
VFRRRRHPQSATVSENAQHPPRYTSTDELPLVPGIDGDAGRLGKIPADVDPVGRAGRQGADRIVITPTA